MFASNNVSQKSNLISLWSHHNTNCTSYSIPAPAHGHRDVQESRSMKMKWFGLSETLDPPCKATVIYYGLWKSLLNPLEGIPFIAGPQPNSPASCLKTVREWRDEERNTPVLEIWECQETIGTSQIPYVVHYFWVVPNTLFTQNIKNTCSFHDRLTRLIQVKAMIPYRCHLLNPLQSV